MNYKLIIIALVTFATPLYGVKITDPKKLFKFWKEGCYKKDVIKIHDNSRCIQLSYNKHKDIPIFKYFLQNGSIRLSFFNCLKWPLFKNAKVVMYMEHNGQYMPVASDCKGIVLEKVLSEVGEFDYESRYVKNKEAQLELECYPRSLVIKSSVTSEEKILEQSNDEHPYEWKKNSEREHVKTFKPYCEEGVMNHNATRILYITYGNGIGEISLDHNYFDKEE